MRENTLHQDPYLLLLGLFHVSYGLQSLWRDRLLVGGGSFLEHLFGPLRFPLRQQPPAEISW